MDTPEWYTSVNKSRAVLVVGSAVVATAAHVGSRVWEWSVPGVAGGTERLRWMALKAAREAWEGREALTEEWSDKERRWIRMER